MSCTSNINIVVRNYHEQILQYGVNMGIPLFSFLPGSTGANVEMMGTAKKKVCEEWIEKFVLCSQHTTLNRPFEANICPLDVISILFERA
jgi:hypothetical protein